MALPVNPASTAAKQTAGTALVERNARHPNQPMAAATPIQYPADTGTVPRNIPELWWSIR